MPRKLHTYEGEHLDITYDAGRCVHAARCVHGLPEVFDPNRRPWIELDRASDVEELVRVIEACPTGALKYVRPAAPETAPPLATIALDPNGPVHIRGALTVVDHVGRAIEEGTRFSLCRCGASASKPFCDGSHVQTGFTDE